MRSVCICVCVLSYEGVIELTNYHEIEDLNPLREPSNPTVILSSSAHHLSVTLQHYTAIPTLLLLLTKHTTGTNILISQNLWCSEETHSHAASKRRQLEHVLPQTWYVLT